MPFTPLRRVPWILAAVIPLASAACTDSAEPTAVLSPDAAVFDAAGGSGPEFFPASVPYSNTSRPNATGRAGRATLVARALFGSDGVTTLEVATGALDPAGPHTGRIARLQIKAFDDGGLGFARSTDVGAGYWIGGIDGVGWGSTLRIQGTIRGADRNRTGVVTLTETVKLRPDLEAVMQAPPEGALGEGVPITGIVRELNGDVGARADCVLYVDGSEVARAPGIWVDASGTVSCAFLPTFDAPGAHALTFAVESVDPGDWDTGNNTATATIDIGNTIDVELHGRMTAYDRQGAHMWANTWDLDVSELEYVLLDEGRSQETYINASQPYVPGDPGAFTGTSRLDVTELSDGVPLASGTITLPGGGFGVSPDGAFRSMVGRRGFWLRRNAGDVTYYTSDFAEYTPADGLTVYHWNYDRREVTGGQLLDWGDDVTLRVIVHTPAGSIRVEATVDLIRTTDVWHQDRCESAWEWERCWVDQYDIAETYGITSF